MSNVGNVGVGTQFIVNVRKWGKGEEVWEWEYVLKSIDKDNKCVLERWVKNMYVNLESLWEWASDNYLFFKSSNE